jgi:dipeptidyl aminopeptidase/acylaminoacyl peptidase
MRSPLEIDRPVRLLHGMLDPDVPFETSLSLADRLTGSDVQVTLIKDGDHRLSRTQDIELLLRTLTGLLA